MGPENSLLTTRSGCEHAGIHRLTQLDLWNMDMIQFANGTLFLLLLSSSSVNACLQTHVHASRQERCRVADVPIAHTEL